MSSSGKGMPAAKAIMPVPNPDIVDQAVVQQFNDLNTAISRELDRRIQSNVSYHSILLISPAGKAYEVTVDDGGSLRTTLKYEPPAPRALEP